MNDYLATAGETTVSTATGSSSFDLTIRVGNRGLLITEDELSDLHAAVASAQLELAGVDDD